MSGGGQTSTTNTNSGPWSGQQGPLNTIYNGALNYLSSSSPQYFPGSTVANQSPYTQAANQGIAATAAQGAPTSGAASTYLQGLLGGNYLAQGNPYMGAVAKSVADSVIPNVQSQFAANGRGGPGSTGEASDIARQIADAIAPQAYNTYNNTLGLMNQGAGLAPGVDASPYYGLGQLAQAGQGQDAYNQSLLNADINRWNYNSNLPLTKLGQASSIIQGGNWGTSGTSTTTQPSGGVGGFLGGLLGGIL